jgi:eukaryotic-like serine/threonine-protein kinase
MPRKDEGCGGARRAGEQMTDRLKFTREWILGHRIGGGGFGQVYAATSTDGETAAVVKLVPKAPGATRELLFVNLDGVRNVVPIIDSGQTMDNWALVMPRAEKSLRQHLDDYGTSLELADAITILKDIGTALVDLDGKVVHRDLKPENVLLLNGRWCLADFGISRYAEASTAPDTQKYALSAPYAAPERWRGERATSATDIYSFGVIAFQLLTRTWPFLGPDLSDFRDQHLHTDPSPLTAGPPGLRAMVGECLFKAPGARPRAANVLARLEGAGRPTRARGLAKLEAANLAEVARRAESARIGSVSRSAAEQRSELVKAASASLKLIEDALFDAITDAAPAALSLHPSRGRGRTLRLSQAHLEFVPAVETSPNSWNWEPPTFDVIAQSGIVLSIPIDQYGYQGRSHSLWFCDAREAGRYQWFEMAFMILPLVRRRSDMNPFALDLGTDAAKALWNGLAEFQLAWPLEPVNIGDMDEFIDRWGTWFAEAAQGRLTQPSRMPERDTSRNWRQT